jgi:hypothetical protein
MMTLQEIRDAILESNDLQALAAVRNDAAIADALSVGRTRLVRTEIGVGTVLEVLGLSVGNTVLDVIGSDPQFRHIKPLLDQGRLRLDSDLVQGTLQAMVPALLSASQAEALASRARVPDPVPVSLVSAALNEEA